MHRMSRIFDLMIPFDSLEKADSNDPKHAYLSYFEVNRVKKPKNAQKKLLQSNVILTHVALTHFVEITHFYFSPSKSQYFCMYLNIDITHN